MVFPIENGTTWDGNILNASAQKLYSYDLDIPDTTVMEMAFSKPVKVIQSNIPENVVNRDQRYELYAENAGMIVNYGITLEYCTVDCPDEKTIEAGRFIHMTLKAYGEE